MIGIREQPMTWFGLPPDAVAWVALGAALVLLAQLSVEQARRRSPSAAPAPSARPGGGAPFSTRDKGQLLANLQSEREQIVDARPHGRFTGSEPEPRPGLRSGHIPGSANVPASALIDPDTGTFRSAEELRQTFEDAGVDLARPVVTTCGSGVTAATVAFALHLLGRDDVAVYDGSWAEWGQPGDTPVVS